MWALAHTMAASKEFVRLSVGGFRTGVQGSTDDLAYGGCARSTSGSQNGSVLPKRHNSRLTKIKLLWPLLILNSRILGLI